MFQILFKKEYIMNDTEETADETYPLTVEEYNDWDIVAENVEVE